MANYPSTTTSSFSGDIVLTNGGKAAVGTTTPGSAIDVRSNNDENLMGLFYNSTKMFSFQGAFSGTAAWLAMLNSAGTTKILLNCNSGGSEHSYFNGGG